VTSERAILHVDMDAFYASVEELDHPHLKGKPVIVGGAGRRAVVAAANYAARRFAIRSAMPVRTALARCPGAILMPPRMARYKEISARVFEIFHELTPLVEGLSLDEAFLDVTASTRLLGNPEKIAAEVRRRIREDTGLTASVGVANNKLVAKIASDLHKPDGLCRIGADELGAVLDPLPIERLWGIGPKSLPAVTACGILCFRDLRTARDETLWRLFGRHAKKMRDLASGIDDRPVCAQRDEKWISAECTFDEDICDERALHLELSRLVDRTAARLRAAGLATALLGVKVRRADFSTLSRRRAFSPPTQDTAVLQRLAAEIFDAWRKTHRGAAVRLLGAAAGNLQRDGQRDLFAAAASREATLDAAVDDVRRRFGHAGLMRASSLGGAAGGRGTRRRPT